jgi:DNA-binding LytR/AlgR family response regulator
MILKALIIDDEPLAHDIILAFLSDMPFIEVVGQCYLASEALDILQNQPIDLMFLDINMPKLKGIDLLKILPSRPQVIITSAYRQYALESFELDVCDYLLKPFGIERFAKAVNKACELHKLIHSTDGIKPQTIVEQKIQTIFIKVDRKRLQIAVNDICYLEAYGNYVKVWVKDKCYLTPRTLTSFEQQLGLPGFIRIHKSFIVQKQHIKSIETAMVQMNNAAKLPLGKTFKHLAREIG